MSNRYISLAVAACWIGSCLGVGNFKPNFGLKNQTKDQCIYVQISDAAEQLVQDSVYVYQDSEVVSMDQLGVSHGWLRIEPGAAAFYELPTDSVFKAQILYQQAGGKYAGYAGGKYVQSFAVQTSSAQTWFLKFYCDRKTNFCGVAIQQAGLFTKKTVPGNFSLGKNIKRLPDVTTTRMDSIRIYNFSCANAKKNEPSSPDDEDED